MTLIINDLIKQKLTSDEFNCVLKMMSHFIIIFRFVDDGEFMRLIKKLYILKYTNFEIMFDYFTHIKIFEERIIVTNVIFIFDKQTILNLFMTLLEHFQFLIKI